MLIDLHQHVWTPGVLELLRSRTRLPFVSDANGLCTLHCGGERPYVIDVATERAEQRSELLRRDGAHGAIVALSSPIGIESLPREEALELIDAHLDGVSELGPSFGAWGPVAVDQPDPDDVDDLLDRGCVGISIPAGALAEPHTLSELASLLGRVQHHGAPLFIHPGATTTRTREASMTEPLWWRALTDYVAQMQAAWLAFATRARPAFPNLRVVFAMLAGTAPLLLERLATRGGPELDLADPLTFYDTSSYGPRAVETMARLVGPAQLVHGSDRPVLEPIRTGRERELMLNAGRLLTPTGAPA